MPDAEPSTSARESTATWPPRWRAALAASFVTTASALMQLWTPLAATARTAAETPAGAGASTAETRTVLPLPASRLHHLGASRAARLRRRKKTNRDADATGVAETRERRVLRRRRRAIESQRAPVPPGGAGAVGPCVVRIDVDFDAQNAHDRVFSHAATDEALDREREAFAARRGAKARRRDDDARRATVAAVRASAAKAKKKSESGGHGQGCGLVIDSENGLIVTNAHVIKGRGVVRVTLADGRSVPGDVVGVDALADIASARARRASGDVASGDGEREKRRRRARAVRPPRDPRWGTAPRWRLATG